MPQTQSDREELVSLVELAQRYVRTTEGARLYGKPIGSPIGEVGEDEDGQKRPITIERLKSLQSQFETAKKTGNTALMKDIQEEFTAAVAEFRATRQDSNLLRELTSSTGKQVQSVFKGK